MLKNHNFYQAIHAKEISEGLISKLREQVRTMTLETSASASSSAAKLEKQIVGNNDGGSVRHPVLLSSLQNDADSALAGLWGGSSIVAASRGLESGDGDRQLRAIKSTVQVLQMELADARLQSERSAENEGRLRTQLQRVMTENDAALVMLGQVCS